MPELPEVETTLRGILPLVVGRRIAVMHMYDRRLRWSVPRWLPARVAGASEIRLYYMPAAGSGNVAAARAPVTVTSPD